MQDEERLITSGFRAEDDDQERSLRPVSYTHLTLPTTVPV